jgi:hypothetical protein
MRHRHDALDRQIVAALGEHVDMLERTPFDRAEQVAGLFG